jgi:ribosomal protein S18 acetylase RimI-like enzyme
MSSDQATGEGLALRADGNLRAVSSAWALAAGGSIWTNDDVFAALSGAETRAYNRAFVLRRPADPLSSFREAREHLVAHAPVSRLYALESMHIDESVLSAAGLQRDIVVPSMALHPIDAALSGPDVEMVPVRSHSLLAVLVGLVATTFEFHHNVLTRVFNPRLLQDPAWQGYVAYVDGAPAATATLYRHDRVAGIYYVGTLKQYRRRGLGEAVTRQCVVDGFAAGCDMASLQASPEGQPVYKRMGFQLVGYYKTYIPQGGVTNAG